MVDTYLPFSLQHFRSGQYRFSRAEHDSGTVNPEMSGRHGQAFLDEACSDMIGSNERIGTDNVKQREAQNYVYNEELIYELVRIGVSNEHWLFYSDCIAQHNITPMAATAEGARTALLQHLFSGDCVLGKGMQCTSVVRGERWSQSVGIRLIDLTCEWVDENRLSTADIGIICRALGLQSSNTNKRRSLLSKLANQRRLMLSSLDVAKATLASTFECLGSTSSLEGLRAMCTAHDVPLKDNGKQELMDDLIGHVARGKCVDNKGPACESLTQEMSPSMENGINMEICVLKHLCSLLSTRQLHRILDLYGVVYGVGDSKKRLKRNLSNFVQNLEKQKRREWEAERDRSERVQKLNEVRKMWPKLVPPRLKEKIVRDFREATSCNMLSTFTCACCARDIQLKDRRRVSHTEICLDLLSGPTSNWVDEQSKALPTPFNSGLLKNKLVDANGVHAGNGETYDLDLCNTCARGLRKNILPKNALANRLYLGPIPDELKDLTMVEESLIARARAKSWIVRLQENESGQVNATAQRGLKGHTIIFPQDPGKLRSVLPAPIEETLTFICVVFVGSGKLTNEWLRTRAKPLVVRREKVYTALKWLQENNPLYKDVQVSVDNLQALPEEDVLPYHIEHVHSNEGQDALVARYDNLGEPQALPEQQLHFESVVVTDVDAHTPAKQLTAAAIRHMTSKGKAFVQVAHGSKPMNEFFNVELFPMLYPTLYPYGCGGFEDKRRNKAVSLKAHVKHLFSLSDKRFQTHYSFLFTVFNILQRRELLLQTSLKVKKSAFAKFAKEFSMVSSEAVGEVLQRVEKGERVTASTEEERRVFRLMKEVNLVTAKIPGSSASRVSMRNEIRALTITHGMPTFYITVNPADTHNPIVKFLSGADIKIDEMLEDEIPKVWEQSMLISSNPSLGAKFFNLYLKAFLRTVLGYTGSDVNIEGGILGTVKAHYGCVEAQGRGSLHCHMLVWIEGALNPDEIRDKVMANAEWGKELLAYLDDTITNTVPVDPVPNFKTDFDDKDPCTLRGADLSDENLQRRLALRAKDVSRLAERVQRHRHSHTCYKYYKPGEERKCRFDLSDENVRRESTIDPERGSISLRCLDGLVNNFNMTMLEAIRCNMDIQFVGSGKSAKAMIYYVTDYITKSQLKTHIAYAALQVAVHKCEQLDDDSKDYVHSSKRLLQKCAYALVSHQELSAQQVVSYLLDYEDHFTSHSYSNLYWPSFERFVDREMPLEDVEKLREVAISREEDSDVDEVEGRIDEDDTQGEISKVDEPGETSESGDEAEGEACNNEEEVSIAIKPGGEVVELPDQVSDYVMRPREVEEYCLWDFVAKTEKVRCKENRVGHNDGGNGAEDLGSSDDERVDKEFDGRKGAKKQQKAYDFGEGHKECGRRRLRLRKSDIVPVLIGPAIPRRDRAECYERHCRLMLLLFKPWRRPTDLLAVGDSWISTYQNFVITMECRHQEYMNNMQVLHECRDERDDHMQTRLRGRERASGEKGSTAVRDVGSGLEDVDMGEVLEHLSEIERMSSRKCEAMKSEANQCLDELVKAGWYERSQSVGPYERGEGRGGLQLVREDRLEEEWKHAYEKSKNEWKDDARGLKQAQENEGEVHVSGLDYFEEEDQATVLLNDLGCVEISGNEAVQRVETMTHVVEKWTLNTEQKRAFVIVAEHSMIDKQEQLLMYLGGPGGTGKSRVVNALRDFFGLRKEGRRFRLAAYTGVAARNVGGATLHALLQLNESDRQTSAKARNDLAATWEGVDYLFIDEVSMIGCEMLHNISKALTEAKGNTTAFGGVNVIFAGDFAQLPPIGDTRLYKNVDTSLSTSGATRKAQAKVLGRLLWLSIEVVVLLHETMRQSGAENQRFTELLNRMRTGVCTGEDYEMLKSRVLAKAAVKLSKEWRAAPVIVANNASKDAINVRAAEAFAEERGERLEWYHAVDTHKKSKITDASLIESLEAQHSGLTKHRLRKIPLVMGMPVAINHNFDVRAGVVNGSWGYVRCVRYTTNDDGRRYLNSCVVEIPGSEAVSMPHLPPYHFPILTDVTEIKFEHNASHRRCIIKRRQVPVEPGFAMTAHKAQGQTMSKIVVDLEGCSGTEQPYVMVSRCTSLDGLLILRDFDKSKITKRVSEDLRREFARLKLLGLGTIVKYGSEREVLRAKKEMEDLQGKVGRGEKRKSIGGNDKWAKRVRKK